MSQNENLPPLPRPAVGIGCDPGDGGTIFHLRAFSETQMRDYAEQIALGAWQQGWNECSDLREKQIADAERDAARYRWLRSQSHLSLVVVDRSPEHIDKVVDEMMREPT